MNRKLSTGNLKRIFLTLCVFMLCVADQRTGSCTGETQLIFSSMPPLIVTVMALAHYPLRSYLRPPFYVWTFLCALGAPLLVWWGYGKVYFPKQFTVFVLFGVLWGFLALRTLLALILEKQRSGMKLFALGGFVLLMGLMCASRYDYSWPWFYFAAFLLLYVTNFSGGERKNLLYALQDGIIAAFFVLQGLAFLFRPYDTLRYLGLYTNTNMNALFYTSVYCAFLSKFCLLETAEHLRGRKGVQILRWVCFAFAASVWSFVLLTMCRSAMVGMALATAAAFLYCMFSREKKRLFYGLRSFAIFAAVMTVSFPVVYGAVRFLPPLFHHPVWFYNEYSEDKIQPGEAWNSPKYTDWRAVLNENFGRFLDLLGTVGGDSGVQSENASGVGKADGDNSRYRGEGGGAEVIAGLDGGSGEDGITAITDSGSNAGYTGIPRDNSTAADDSGALDNDYGTDISLSAMDAGGSGMPAGGEDSSAAGSGSAAPELPSPDDRKSTTARLTIYRHYLSLLNLRGHLESENGIQLTEDFYAPHAHNLFLQYAFNFGLPAGILFLLFMAACGLRLLIGLFTRRLPVEYLTALLLFGSLAAFGMTEVMWRNGQLSNTLLYLIPMLAFFSPEAADRDTEATE